ncbi:MAG: SAM-dependent methyltransferase [Nocardiopsaceae bacterium]|nr:SAM-dependent methyltransferase [Nocardiopsaceae bacterium]
MIDSNDPVIDPTIAHQARVYNYLLGGKDHFAADRAYADAAAAYYPGTAAIARANRDFLGRAVRFLAGEAGLSQFLDVGTGIPAPGNTHEVAQEARPDSRIVYVDNDPVVLAHARALLVGHAPGTTAYLNADIRDPGQILRRAARTLDLGKPVGLLLLFILHAIPDADDPYRAVASLMDALPSGSYLAVSHIAGDQGPQELKTKMGEITREMSRHQYIARSRAEVARFFNGLDLVEPGLVQVRDWRPDPVGADAADSGAEGAPVWAGVARKPLSRERARSGGRVRRHDPFGINLVGVCLPGLRGCRRRGQRRRSLTSKTSRMPSPTALKAITVSTIAMPGG